MDERSAQDRIDELMRLATAVDQIEMVVTDAKRGLDDPTSLTPYPPRFLGSSTDKRSAIAKRCAPAAVLPRRILSGAVGTALQPAVHLIWRRGSQ